MYIAASQLMQEEDSMAKTWVKEKIQSIKDLLQMHSGNHNLKFVVYDDEEELKLEMNSRLQKIKISQELLEELKAQEVYYKLN